MATKTYSPAEIAARPGFMTDAKTLRIFLRQDFRARGLETPGKGSRWAIDLEAGALGRRFRAWSLEREAAAQAKLEARDQEIEAQEIEEADADMEASFGSEDDSEAQED